MNRIGLNYLLLVMLLVRSGNATVWAQVVQQATLTGQITNATDGQPLPFASVYLNGTTRGTVTDEKGRFTLGNVSFGANELVISYTGFTPVRQPIRVIEKAPNPVAIALIPVANMLTGLVVTAKKDKVWLRQVNQFERDLIGTSPFARQCVLTNPEVLQFEESGGLLIATAREPLVIRNEGLGYKLTYTLAAFRSQSRTGKVVFGGTTLFSELQPESPRQVQDWQRNRQRAYVGSLRHLMASLAAGTHEQEGFLVYQTDPARPLLANPPPMLTSELGRHLKPFNVGGQITPGALPHERWLVSSSPLEVFYTRIASRESPYRDAQYAFSQLVLPQQSIGFTVSGKIVAPRGFDAVGYLSSDRLATALPDDWNTAEAAQQPNSRPNAKRSQPASDQVAGEATLDSLVQRWKVEAAGLAPIVFVHIDKPLYLTGDRIWLSGYVLDPPSQRCDTARVGPALNVELWSAANTLVQHQWLPVETGRTEGVFRLSDTLYTGTYTLRAYTDVDRQMGGPAFERPVWVVNHREKSVDQPAQDQPAKVVDQAAFFDGSYIVEAPGAPYRTTVLLDSTQLTLTLDARPKTGFPAVFLLVEARAKLVHTLRIPIQAVSTTVRLSTLTWPSGTALLSLMDSTGRIWSQRSVQVPERASPVQASVTYTPARTDTDTAALLVVLQDEVGRPVQAQVSIAITDADLVPADSLATDLPRHLIAMPSRRVTYPATATITPDITLRGRVLTREKLPVIVEVIATDKQGVLKRTVQTTADGLFQVSQLALTDTARLMVTLTNRKGKPINGTVSFGQQSAPFRTVTGWADTPNLLARWRSLIQAGQQRQRADSAFYRQTDARQLREVVVRATRPVDERPADVQLRSLHNQVDQTIVLDEQTMFFENVYFLIQAKVAGIRVEPVLTNGRTAYSVKFPGASSIMNAKVAAQTSFSPPPPKAPADATMQNPLFLMDGFPVNDNDGTQLLAFSPSTIERIEVLKTGAISSIYGASSSRGVIALYTKTTRDLAKLKGISRYEVPGYASPQPFQMRKATSGNVPEQRDVLVWEPLAETNPEGQLRLPVTLSRTTRRLRVTIQGISTTGQAISCVQLLPVSVAK
ncbi:carboxypeptidase-like regulatory domain-containing protein [Fibrella aquatica]|uniref:carboxypeptidase-like regulatory domain-containing protein n=1 Tax=Fibrella aquatica TaxID=3242487 RepID=UPI00352304F7